MIFFFNFIHSKKGILYLSIYKLTKILKELSLYLDHAKLSTNFFLITIHQHKSWSNHPRPYHISLKSGFLSSYKFSWCTNLNINNLKLRLFLVCCLHQYTHQYFKKINIETKITFNMLSTSTYTLIFNQNIIKSIIDSWF
jgi:hypothetical protein